MNNFKGIPEFFFKQFLTQPASALPKGAQWVVVFESFPIKAIFLASQYEPREWNISEALKCVTMKRDFQEAKGCLFAQAVSIPGETLIVSQEGLSYNSFLRTPIANGRQSPQELRVSFLDTNVSFVENVMRPWVLATGYFGLIARPKNDVAYYRTNISFYKLGCYSADLPPFPLMHYQFYDACPVSITSEEYNYTQTTNPIMREVTFIFNHYTVDSSKNAHIIAKPKN